MVGIRKVLNMSRKNNPQETREKIISISSKLFLEKGFDRTSMQDIVNALGMSKGAIYHHFKSKAEIISAARESNNVEQVVENWVSHLQGYTAKEKLIYILNKNMHDTEIHSLDSVFSSQMKSSDFVLAYMQDNVNKNACAIAKIMSEGIVDGSITTDFPDECAEVFLLLLNIWCDPVIFECSNQKSIRRLKFLQCMMKSMGVDILSDEFIQKILDLLEKLYIK